MAWGFETKDVLTLARPHLLGLPQQVPPTGIQVFKCQSSMEDTLTQTTTMCVQIVIHTNPLPLLPPPPTHKFLSHIHDFVVWLVDCLLVFLGECFFGGGGVFFLVLFCFVLVLETTLWPCFWDWFFETRAHIALAVLEFLILLPLSLCICFLATKYLLVIVRH